MQNRRHALLTGLALLGPAAAQTPRLRLTLLPYPGYFTQHPDGRLSGLDVDIAVELAARAGCEFEILATNPSRMWADLVGGAVELTGGAAYLPARRSEAEFLWLVRGHEVVVLHPAQAVATPTRAAFDADPSLRLGVLRSGRRGEQAQAWVDGLRQQDRVSESADMPGLLRAFLHGRVAALLLFPAALHGHPGLTDYPLLDWLPQDRFTAGWAVSQRGVPEPLRQRLREAGRSLREDGTLMRLLKKNLGAAVARHYEFLPPP